jgi:M6 family metalloprotease-like protein
MRLLRELNQQSNQWRNKEEIMKLQKLKIKSIIGLMTFMLLLSNLYSMQPSPYYDPNARLDNPRHRRQADGWYPELIFITKITQPDGVEIELEIISGGVNNLVGRLLRLNEYTVVRDNETGFHTWARLAPDGTLESTGKPIHLYDPKELGLEKNLRMSDEQAKKVEEMLEEVDRLIFGGPSLNDNTRSNRVTCPTEADSLNPVNKIIIYVSLADQDPNFTFPIPDLVTQFEGLSAYYNAVSYGKLHTQANFYHKHFSDPKYTTEWLLPEDPPGVLDRRLSYLRERELLLESIAELDSLGINVDSNNNGFVDSVTMIIRGMGGESWRPNLAYYAPELSTSLQPSIDGKLVSNYIVHYENNIMPDSLLHHGLHIMAHEFGHALGLPDLYFRNSGISWYVTVGGWDIMNNFNRDVASSSLPSMSAYLKYKYTKWI